MTALKCDLDRVLADQAHVLDAQLVGRQALDAGKAARRTAFASALGARAGPPKLFTGVSALVAALPRDLHDLSIAVDVDVDGKGIGVLQLLLSGLVDVDHGELAERLDRRASRDLRGDVDERLGAD
jgi:hypothetical protein